MYILVFSLNYKRGRVRNLLFARLLSEFPPTSPMLQARTCEEPIVRSPLGLSLYINPLTNYEKTLSHALHYKRGRVRSLLLARLLICLYTSIKLTTRRSSWIRNSGIVIGERKKKNDCPKEMVPLIIAPIDRKDNNTLRCTSVEKNRTLQ